MWLINHVVWDQCTDRCTHWYQCCWCYWRYGYQNNSRNKQEQKITYCVFNRQGLVSTYGPEAAHLQDRTLAFCSVLNSCCVHCYCWCEVKWEAGGSAAIDAQSMHFEVSLDQNTEGNKLAFSQFSGGQYNVLLLRIIKEDIKIWKILFGRFPLSLSLIML